MSGARPLVSAELGLLRGCAQQSQLELPAFRQTDIPEANDLNVLPDFRNEGSGNALPDAIESTACDRSGIVGLGVGLYRDYGAAQRIYVRRGYLPDGQGVMYANKRVTPGDTIRIDDDATLMFTRTIQKL